MARLMRRAAPALALATAFVIAPAIAGEERCETRPNNTGRICQREVRDLKITSVADAAGDVEMITIDVRNRGNKSTAIDTLALVGGAMMSLVPDSTQSARAATMTKLLANAGSGKPNVALLGRYQWAVKYAGDDMFVYVDRKKRK